MYSAVSRILAQIFTGSNYKVMKVEIVTGQAISVEMVGKLTSWLSFPFRRLFIWSRGDSNSTRELGSE